MKRLLAGLAVAWAMSSWMSLASVAVAEDAGKPVIVVSVTSKVPASQLSPRDVIPRELDGVPVDVQVVGKLRAF